MQSRVQEFNMILVIDNYDSFVYNLVQYISEFEEDVRVFRNDKITVQDIESLNPDAILISPGPCTPKEAGISVETIKTFAGKIPLFGVCLGHQSIGEAFGGNVIRAQNVVHGKTSQIYHKDVPLFQGTDNPFIATRYHSLIVERESLPDCLEIIAETEAGEIMALQHKEYTIAGLQFHPESILTRAGKTILKNFFKPTL